MFTSTRVALGLNPIFRYKFMVRNPVKVTLLKRLKIFLEGEYLKRVYTSNTR